ncbi:MAG: hypothetical protein FWF47_08585 [Clostridia bacterium]|nr:hypothetical protein [Clostridia bacterium]
METTHANSEPLVFKELPKEQRKALQKEFSKTTAAKKGNKTLIIIAILFAAIALTGAVLGLVTGHESSLATFPAFFLCIIPSVVHQQRFEKWLKEEKNIITSHKK